MERFKLLFSESLRSLGANASTTLAATVTVLIGMFLLGLFIAFGTWVVSWSNHVKRELVVHVYYCTSDTCAKEATTAQMNHVANIASSSPLVKRIVPVSKEQALAQMKKTHPEEVGALPTNPFPNALTVVPKRGEDVERVALLFKADPAVGIDKIDYGKKTDFVCLSAKTSCRRHELVRSRPVHARRPALRHRRRTGRRDPPRDRQGDCASFAAPQRTAEGR